MSKEKLIKDSPEPVTISGTKTILNQMINCICKIKVQESLGTGFFCKIPIKNKGETPFLFTNYHVLHKNYFDKSKILKLLLNDEKEIKHMNLGISRMYYFDEKYDIALIEIRNEDNITNFLGLDDNLFRDDEDTIFKTKSIYVLHYPNGKNASVSYGLVNSIEQKEIKHTCSTLYGSSGSPILNLETNKVIGIHKEGMKLPTFNFNKGTFLKYPLNDFINNNGNNNNYNIYSNYSMNNNNFNFPNQINNLNINNFGNDMNIPGPKMNIIFQEKTDPPHSTTLVINYGTTVDQLLTNFFIKINKPELIGLKEKVQFIYNLRTLKFGDQTPIEKFFKRSMNLVNIQVIYTNI